MAEWSFLQIEVVKTLIGFLALALVVFLFDRIFKHVIKKILNSLSRDRNNWLCSFLQDEKFIFWVLSLPYLAIIHVGLDWIPNLPAIFISTAQRIIGAGFILLGLFILSNAFRVINEIYSQMEVSRLRPIKGYLQGILIVSYLLGFICILAVLLNRSPTLFLSGLGALTAVLLLVFKDSILSLVAGVQLTANDLIRVGDWIEMPQFNADGDVQEIALHSVKIQNWDKTITVIPAHKFLENSFKNWRGMQNSGGRRIKRPIYVDMSTIRFLTEEELERVSRFALLRDYLAQKRKELSEHNQALSQNSDLMVNARRLTNIGTFRAYLINYLKKHPGIHQNMIQMVRQLAPCAKGLPIEIYTFTNTVQWVPYEGIQADIFDHILAIAPEFGLQVFQEPSGGDLKSVLNEKILIPFEHSNALGVEPRKQALVTD